MNDQNPFEQFINDRYGDAEQLDHLSKPGTISIHLRPDVLARLRSLNDPAMRAKIEAAMSEQMQQQAREQTARLFGLATGLTARSLTASEIDDIRRQMHDDYRARLMRLYGAGWINDVETLARTQGVTFEQAALQKQLADVVNRSASALQETFARLAEFMQSPAVRDALNQLGQQINERMQEGIADDSEPNNRHSRRASKHTKPLKDGDQQWKTTRRYRNRR